MKQKERMKEVGGYLTNAAGGNYISVWVKFWFTCGSLQRKWNNIARCNFRDFFSVAEITDFMETTYTVSKWLNPVSDMGNGFDSICVQYAVDVGSP